MDKMATVNPTGEAAGYEAAVGRIYVIRPARESGL